MARMSWSVFSTHARDIIDAKDEVSVYQERIYVMELNNVHKEMMKCSVVSFFSLELKKQLMKAGFTDNSHMKDGLLDF